MKRATTNALLAATVLAGLARAQAPVPAQRWVADQGASVGISRLVASWTSSGASPETAHSTAARRQPRLDLRLAAGRAAIVFDGEDGLVAPRGLPAGGSCSRGLAVRVDSLQRGGVLLGATKADALRLQPGTGRLVLSQGGVDLAASGGLTAGEFHVLVATYDAASGLAELFVDGAPVASGALPPPADPAVAFGASKLGGLGFEGAIAEARLFGSALTAAERAAVEAELGVFADPAFPRVELTVLPREAQVFQRDASNVASLRVEGVVLTPGYDRARIAVTRDGAPYAAKQTALVYSGGGAISAPFALAIDATAGLHDYELRLELLAGAQSTPLAVRSNLCVGDVFLVDGQSNAVARDFHGEALGDAYQDPFVRSFGDGRWVYGLGPPIVVSKGAHERDLNWDLARSLVPHDHATVGQWALAMATTLRQQEGVPIAVINGGCEGTSVLEHARNDADPTDPKGLYGRLLHRAREAGVADDVRALFYYQGEVDGEIESLWADAFADMHAGWLADYAGLERVYLFQVREGCNLANDGVREAQRQLGEALPGVTVVPTTAVSGHDGCHFFHAGYAELGQRTAQLVARDLYGAPFPDVDAPRIGQAQWASPAQDALLLTFEPAGLALVVDPGAESFVSVSDGTQVTLVTALGPSRLRVQLAGPSLAGSVTWRGHAFDGPWIRTAGGVGALTFFDFPVAP